VAPPRLLLVFHSRAGTTERLATAVADGARTGAPSLDLSVLDCFAAQPGDVLDAAALLLGTPARFGYMSGAMKDFFERIYHPCLEATAGRPYGLFVKGDTDVDGAVSSVERIVVGLRWRRVLPPLTVVGDLTEADLEAGFELGATLAAGIEAGIF
jgi:multimeric flavodoxin WrbA